MRRFGISVAGLCIALFAGESFLKAQPPNRRGQGQQQRGGGRGAGGGMRQQQGPGSNNQQTPPLLRVFDVDGDGQLSASEIDNAASALRKLDSDRNGRLSAEELRPGGQSNAGGGNRGQAQERRGGPASGATGRPGGQGGRQNGPGAQNGRPGGGGQPGGGRGGDPARGDAAFAAQLLELDGNKDGQLAVSELPEHMHTAFIIADRDKNGTLDDAERTVLAEQYRRNMLPPAAERNLERKNVPTQGRRPGGN